MGVVLHTTIFTSKQTGTNLMSAENKSVYHHINETTLELLIHTYFVRYQHEYIKSPRQKKKSKGIDLKKNPKLIILLL